MTTRFEKIMRLADELLSYCHLHGAKELHLDIAEEDKSVTLVVRAPWKDLPNEDLEWLRQCLNAPRQREIEQDFWELIGETENSCEITLCGMLCDHATVDYDRAFLTITLTRMD